MQDKFNQLSHQARMAVQKRDWNSVSFYSEELQKSFAGEAEGYFLSGLANKAFRKSDIAKEKFSKALEFDSKRYDAAIELAALELTNLNHNVAFQLLNEYRDSLSQSPLYLNFAGSLYSNLGLHNQAWTMFDKANQLQPGIAIFQNNLASSSVLVGKVSIARSVYQELINKNPNIQKNHYELSKIAKATSREHIDQMKQVLKTNQLPPSKNIFLYYAIGKELEDLESWDESFHFYEQAGNAVTSVSNYDVTKDVALIDQIINLCNRGWLSESVSPNSNDAQPIFIVGLPRTGTTLTERIIASHSQVESVDETFFLQMAIRKLVGQPGFSDIDEHILSKAVKEDVAQIAFNYMNSVTYKLTGKSVFVEKYPFNFLYIGFIAKAFPNAKIVYLKRNPMDGCFAMFKQSFFKFAYNLQDLGQYYVAQAKLRQHWKENLGERLIELDYESLVANQEHETRELLNKLGLKFENACLEFEKNPAASATASTLQIREKVHNRSVNKWKNYKKHLAPLEEYLIQNGIEVT